MSKIEETVKRLTAAEEQIALLTTALQQLLTPSYHSELVNAEVRRKLHAE
jgi:hypothetical protein